VLGTILRKYGITKIRSLSIPWFDYRLADMRKIGFALFTRWSKVLKDPGYKKPDYFIGFFRSGRMDADYLEKMLARIRPGVTEINLHPGTDNSKIGERYGFLKDRYGWACNWERELNTLLSHAVKDAISANNISLINYKEF